MLKSVKSVKMSRSKIYCHSDALEAYTYSKTIRTYAQGSTKLLDRTDSFNDVFIQRSQRLNPLFAVKNDNKELMFFAGWRWYELCLSANIEEIEVIEHMNCSDLRVAEIAWQYLFSEHLFDMSRHDSLEQLASLIGAMPICLREKLLTSMHSYSAQKSVENITGEGREAVRHQLKSSLRESFDDTKNILKRLMDNQ
jgi:hypothetical protein